MPEDIVLGPPRTAFASASGRATTNRSSDTPRRSSFTSHDDSSVKNERSNFRDRYSREGQRHERDGERPRDTRPATATNRRSVKDDSDLWSSVRQTRTPGQEDGERSYRRNGDRDYDRDRDGGRESKIQRGLDGVHRDGERDAEADNVARRGHLGRGRNEPTWYRDEGQKEEHGNEGSGPGRHRDWERRGNRGPDRDWGRSTRPETDPEWMDPPEAEEQTQAKTSEDFEKWKRLMKTSNSATQEAPLSPVEQRSSHGTRASGPGIGAGKSKIDTPLVVDSQFDEFFGLWNEPKKNKEVTGSRENGVPPVPIYPAAKSSKPSKFTGFFNPRPEPEPPQERLPPLPSAQLQDSSNEDKEGFQRILKLLDQQQPQNGQVTSPPRTQVPRETPASPPIQPSRTKEKNDLFSLLQTSSPQSNAMPQTKDSEFLLKLMQQPQQGRYELGQTSTSGRRTAQDPSPGLLPFSNMMISPNEALHQSSSLGPPPGFFDEGPPRDKLNPGSERRGPPPGFFDPGKLQRPSPVGAPQSSGYISGIQRPPGLELMPQGYSQHTQPQRSNMVPPPGFQAQLRGQNVLPPSPFPNNVNQMGGQVNRHGAPPPGFINPPPPGFTLPFSQDGLPFGPFNDGTNFGQGGFGPQRRQ